jgi:hypothetical protein
MLCGETISHAERVPEGTRSVTENNEWLSFVPPYCEQTGNDRTVWEPDPFYIYHFTFTPHL